MRQGVSNLPSQSKRPLRRALKRIQNAALHAEKQQVIEDYLYLKISPARAPAENAEVLQHKFNKLIPQLDPVDAEQLSACCAYYIKHIASLTRQKGLVQSQNAAAKVARLAEQADELPEAIQIVTEYMQVHLQARQGPQARLRVLGNARSDVEAALAFPRRAGWDSMLDEHMQFKASEAPVHGPGHSMTVAQQLNHTDSANAELLSDH